jgi:hypothetical protein
MASKKFSVAEWAKINDLLASAEVFGLPYRREKSVVLAPSISATSVKRVIVPLSHGILLRLSVIGLTCCISRKYQITWSLSGI